MMALRVSPLLRRYIAAAYDNSEKYITIYYFTAMKLAHLILTHANPEQLRRLVLRLAYKDTHCYIHLDKKTDIGPFMEIAAIPNVFFVQDRVKVSWGGYSIVQATVNGLKAILSSGNTYDHINLLSGQDYPIQKNDDIHAWLRQNKGRTFMHSLSVMEEWKEAIPRVTKYYLTNYSFPGNVRAEQLLSTLLPARKMPMGMVPMGRSQWFTASYEAVDYMVRFLEDNPSVVRFFKLTWAPDELIFQTILYNSPLRDTMVNDNLLYVDWSNGGASPKVLTMDDAAALERSDKLFARKFNPAVDHKILVHLDRMYH